MGQNKNLVVCLTPVKTNPFFFADTLMLPRFDGSSCREVPTNNTAQDIAGVKIKYPGEYEVWAKYTQGQTNLYQVYPPTKQNIANVVHKWTQEAVNVTTA